LFLKLNFFFFFNYKISLQIIKKREIFLKNLFIFYLFIEFFFFFNFKSYIFIKKKNKHVNSFLRAPNRYKKSQNHFIIKRYILNYFLQININFFFFNYLLLYSYIYIKIIFFESSILFLKKINILISNNYHFFLNDKQIKKKN